VELQRIWLSLVLYILIKETGLQVLIRHTGGVILTREELLVKNNIPGHQGRYRTGRRDKVKVEVNSFK
jgi:hypothetical protein